MARKINKPADPAEAQATEAAQAASDAAADLALLHPQLNTRLRGRLLTLREYVGIEGLHLQASIRPLLEDLYAAFKRADAPPTALQVREVFSRHAVNVQWLMAQSTVPYPLDPTGLQTFTEKVAEVAQFISTLDDIEFDQLLTAWWGATSSFFIRRFREHLLAAREEASRLATSASTPP